MQTWVVGLFSILQNIAVGASAIVVAVVGILGLRAWRNELTGKEKFEVAKRILMLSMQARDQFGEARNPWTYPTESAKRPRTENESDSESRTRDEWYARAERLQPLTATIRKLNEATWEGEILLNKDIRGLTQPIFEAYRDLSVAIRLHFEFRLMGERDVEIVTIIKDSSRKIFGVEDDDFAKKIDIAIEEMRKQLKKYVI